MLFLAASSPGMSQEASRRAEKPPAERKRVTPPLDPKTLSDSKAAAAAAKFLESAYQGQHQPEGVRMLIAILGGSKMGPGDGWFGPAESRYSWKWLADRSGVDSKKGGIPRSRFTGPDALFKRLDRNKDGVITADDFDWSDRNPYVQMSYFADRLFRRLNAHGNGRLTKDELAQFFDSAALGKDHLSIDDFRDALLGGWGGGSRPTDMPSPATLVRGLFAGELGSMNEGPQLNELAPDFTLKTSDGKQTIQLAKVIQKKPVVIVFGSFT
jgi:hypothetical protein